jgi:hypothetical protein
MQLWPIVGSTFTTSRFRKSKRATLALRNGSTQVLYLFFVSSLALPCLAADDCAKWGGVIDEHHELSVRHEFSRMQDLFCKATSSETSATGAHSAAVNAGIPIPVVDDILNLKVGANYQDDSSNFSKFHEEFCSTNASQASLDTNYATVTRAFSDRALKAAEACYFSTQPGLHVKITPSQHKQLVTIELRYVPTGHESASVSDSTVKPPEAVDTCNANNLFGKTTLPRSAACKWVDSNKDLAFTINTNHGSWVSTLTADPPLPPSKAGDVVQKYSHPIDPNEAPTCSDPDNIDTVQCTWWHETLYPKEQSSRFTVDVILTSDITVAKGPWTRGCTGDAQTTDPWRTGEVIIKCGPTRVRTITSGEGQNRNLPKTTQSYTSKAHCETDGSPVDVRVIANPRGCSAMSLSDGTVVIREIKE